MIQLLTNRQVTNLQNEHTIILKVISSNYWASEYSAHRDRLDEIFAILKENAGNQAFIEA